MPREKKKTMAIQKSLEVKVDLGEFCNFTCRNSMSQEIEYSTDGELDQQSESLANKVSTDLVKDVVEFINQNNLSSRSKVVFKDMNAKKKIQFSDEDLEDGPDRGFDDPSDDYGDDDGDDDGSEAASGDEKVSELKSEDLAAVNSTLTRDVSKGLNEDPSPDAEEDDDDDDWFDD